MKNSKENLQILYSTPFPSTRSGALYNAFPYPTKISPETIALFIACHTNIGDTILDTFGGSGTTGLAALLCDVPTPNMKSLAAQYKLSPKWGPRKAIVYELGVLGSFVADTLCNPPDPVRFEQAAKELVDTVERKINLYETTDAKGKSGTIRHVIWSDAVYCPSCKFEHTYWDLAVQKAPTVKILDKVTCTNCKAKLQTESLERVIVTKTDRITGKKVKQKKRVPVRIYGKTNGKNWWRDVKPQDFKDIARIEKVKLPSSTPSNKIKWGDLYRSGYHLGVDSIYDFYTSRNLLAMASLWDEISNYPKDIQPALRFLVLSYNASHATLMSRVVIKNGQKDFVLTGAQSGVLYISSLPVEKNVYEGVRRKMKTIAQAFDCVKKSQSKVQVVNRSSTKLLLEDKSIDYVFTDPPFGDYIPYSEINQINEFWLGKPTDSTDEIIISASQNKGVNEYGKLMNEVFQEIYRVLKDEGKATVVFHSAKAEVWQALTNSISSAHLGVGDTSILDKVQRSFKQTNSEVSVNGDPLILLFKSKVKKKRELLNSENVIEELIANALNNSTAINERQADRLYSRYLSKCVELDIPITINANAFYDYVRTWDGIV